MKTREEAFSLLNEYTKSESLLKHSLAVEAAMLWYARFYKQDTEEQLRWGICGLLHDFDYEKYPSTEDHPYKGNQILKELNYSDDICNAIMGHATYTQVPRDTLMAKCLFAVDELTGLIMASVLVRPDKLISNLELKSVKKKFKDKRFAAGVNREDVKQGAEELGIELDQHIQNVINAMKEIAETLGLAG